MVFDNESTAEVLVSIEDAEIKSKLSIDSQLDSPVFFVSEDGYNNIVKDFIVEEQNFSLKLKISIMKGAGSLPVFATFENGGDLSAAADVYIIDNEENSSSSMVAYPSFVTYDDKVSITFHAQPNEKVGFTVNDKKIYSDSDADGNAVINIPASMVFPRELFNIKTITKYSVQAESSSGEKGNVFIHSVPRSMMALASVNDVNRPSCVIMDPNASAAFSIDASPYPQKCFEEPLMSHALNTAGVKTEELEFYSKYWKNCDHAYATKMNDLFELAGCRIQDKWSITSIEKPLFINVSGVSQKALTGSGLVPEWAAVWAACDPQPEAQVAGFDPCGISENVLAKIPRVYLAVGNNSVYVDVIKTVRMAIKKSPKFHHSAFLLPVEIGDVASIIVRLANGIEVAKNVNVLYNAVSTLNSLKAELEADQDIKNAKISINLNGSGATQRLDFSSDERFTIKSGNVYINNEEKENKIRVTRNSNYIVEGYITSEEGDFTASLEETPNHVLMLDGPFRGVLFNATFSGNSVYLDACPRVNTIGSFRIDQDYTCMNIAVLKAVTRVLDNAKIYKMPYISNESAEPLPAYNPHINSEGTIVCSALDGENTYLYCHSSGTRPWIRVTDKNFDHPKVVKDIHFEDECIICETPLSEESQIHACYIGSNSTPRVHSHLSSLWNRLSGSDDWSKYISSVNIDSYDAIYSLNNITRVDRDQIVNMSKGVFSSQQVVAIYESIRPTRGASDSPLFASSFESGTSGLYPSAPSSFSSGENLASVLIQFDSSIAQSHSVNISFNGKIAKIFASNADLERTDEFFGIFGGETSSGSIPGASSANTGIFPLASSSDRVSSYSISVSNDLKSMNVDISTTGVGICRIRVLIHPDIMLSSAPDDWVRISSGDGLVSVPSSERVVAQFTADGSETAAVARFYKDSDGVYFNGNFDQLNYGVECFVDVKDINGFVSESSIISQNGVVNTTKVDPEDLVATLSDSASSPVMWRYAVEYVGKAKSSRSNLYVADYKRSNGTRVFTIGTPNFPGVRDGETCAVLIFDVNIDSSHSQPSMLGSMSFNIPISFIEIKQDLLNDSDSDYAVIEAPFTLGDLATKRSNQESYTNVDGRILINVTADKKRITYTVFRPTSGSCQYSFRVYLQDVDMKVLEVKSDSDVKKEINQYLTSNYNKEGNLYSSKVGNNRMVAAFSGKKYDTCIPLISACRYDDLTVNPNANIPIPIDQNGQLVFEDSDENVFNVDGIPSLAALDVYSSSGQFRIGGNKSNMNKWSVMLMLEKETMILTNSESPSEYGIRKNFSEQDISNYIESDIFEVFTGRAKLAVAVDPSYSKALDGSVGTARRIVSEGNSFILENGFRLGINSITCKLPSEYIDIAKMRDKLAPNIEDQTFDQPKFSSLILCSVNGKPSISSHILHDDPSMRRQIDICFGNPFGEHPIHDLSVQSPLSLRPGRRYEVLFDDIYIGKPIVRFTDELRISDFDIDLNSIFRQSPSSTKYIQNSSLENGFADPGDFAHLEHGNEYIDSWTVCGGGCCYSGSYLTPLNGIRSVILESNISNSFSLNPPSSVYANYTFTRSRRSRSSTGVGGGIKTLSTLPSRPSVLDVSLGMRRYPATDPSRFRTVMLIVGDEADSYRIASRNGDFSVGSRPDFKKIRFEFDGSGSEQAIQINNLDTDINKLFCFSHSNYSGSSPVSYVDDFTSSFYFINTDETLVGVSLPASLAGANGIPASIQVATNIATGVVKVSSKGSQSADATGIGAFGVYLKKDGSIGQFGERLAVAIDDPPTGNDFVDVAAGLNFGVAIRRDGSIEAWGEDTFGIISNIPVGSFVSVDCGAHFACAIRSDGNIICWGSNSVGQCNPPAGIFIKARCGWDSAVAIDRNGSATCWGQAPVTAAWSVPNYVFRDAHVGGGPVVRIFPESTTVNSDNIGRYGIGITESGDIVTWGDDDVITVDIPGGGTAISGEYFPVPSSGDFVSIFCGCSTACATDVSGGLNGFGSGHTPFVADGSPRFSSYYGSEFCVHKGGPVIDQASASPVYSLYEENDSPPKWVQMDLADENEWENQRRIYGGRGASSLPITISGEGINRNASVAERNGIVHISFESTREKENSICYASSFPESHRFVDVIKLTSGAKDRNSPSIAVDDDNNRLVAWIEKKNINQSVVCAKSTKFKNKKPDPCFIDSCILSVNKYKGTDPYYISGLQECEISENFYFDSIANDIYFEVEFFEDMDMNNRVAIYSSLDYPDNFMIDGERITSEGVSVLKSQSYNVKFIAPNDPAILGAPMSYRFKAKSFVVDFGQSDILSDYLIVKSTGTIVDGTADDFATYSPDESTGSFYVIFEGVQRYDFDIDEQSQLQFNAYANVPSRDSGIFLPANYSKLPGVKSKIRVMSYLMHIVNDDVDFANGVQYSGKVSFTAPICGIIFKGTDLEKTDGIAVSNAFYPPTADRDTIFSKGSKIVISNDGSTLQLNFVAKDPDTRSFAVQQLRILTIETDSVQDEKTGIFGCDLVRHSPCGVQFKFTKDFGVLAQYSYVHFRAIVYSSSDVDDVVAIFSSITHPHMWRYGDEQYPSIGQLMYINDSIALGFYPDFVDPSSAISSFDVSDSSRKLLSGGGIYYDLLRESLFKGISYRIRIDAIITDALGNVIYKDKIHQQQLICMGDNSDRMQVSEWDSSGAGKFDSVISSDGISSAVDIVAARKTFYISFERFADPKEDGQLPSCPDIFLSVWDSHEDRFDASAQGGKDRLINIGYGATSAYPEADIRRYRTPKVLVDELSNFSIFGIRQTTSGSSIGRSEGSVGYQKTPEILVNVEDLRPCSFNDSVAERFSTGEDPPSYIQARVDAADIFSFSPNSSGDPYPIVLSPFINLDIFGAPGTYAIRVRNENDVDFSPWVPVGGDIPVLPLSVSNQAEYREFQDIFRARFVSRDRISMPWLLSPGRGLKTVCIEALTFFGKTMEFCTEVICEPSIPAYSIEYFAWGNYTVSGSATQDIMKIPLAKYKKYPVVSPFLFKHPDDEIVTISENDMTTLVEPENSNGLERKNVQKIYFEVTFENSILVDRIFRLGNLPIFRKRTGGKNPIVANLIYRGFETKEIQLTRHQTEKNKFFAYFDFKRCDGIMRKDGMALVKIEIPLLGIDSGYPNFIVQFQELTGQINNRSAVSLSSSDSILIPPLDETIISRAFGNSEYYR